MAQSDTTPRETDASVTERTAHPTIRPTLILFGLTVVVSALLMIGITTNPDLVGDENLAEIAIWVVAFVTLLVVLRLLVKIFVLRRTRYKISGTELQREYTLFYRRQAREIPMHRLRGLELDQGRIQTLLGYGDVRFLTGGTNQSLGFLTFENLDNPDEIRDEIRAALIEHVDNGN
jgi:uncharacterized membrane protein YdbT with pleckstrin-like domain